MCACSQATNNRLTMACAMAVREIPSVVYNTAPWAPPSGCIVNSFGYVYPVPPWHPYVNIKPSMHTTQYDNNITYVHVYRYWPHPAVLLRNTDRQTHTHTYAHRHKLGTVTLAAHVYRRYKQVSHDDEQSRLAKSMHVAILTKC